MHFALLFSNHVFYTFTTVYHGSNLLMKFRAFSFSATTLDIYARYTAKDKKAKVME